MGRGGGSLLCFISMTFCLQEKVGMRGYQSHLSAFVELTLTLGGPLAGKKIEGPVSIQVTIEALENRGRERKVPYFP